MNLRINKLLTVKYFKIICLFNSIDIIEILTNFFDLRNIIISI